MAVYQTDRYRCLAVLVSSYRRSNPSIPNYQFGQ